MGHQDDGSTFLMREMLDRGQQVFCFRIGQYRGGFIENQNAGTGQQHLENLDPLLLGYRQLIHPRVGFDAEPQAGGHGGDLLGGLRQPLPVGTGLQVTKTEQNVLCHGEGFHQLEMLVNHADALCGSIERPLQTNRVVVDEQRSGFRRIEPCGNVHQGRLARSVLAQQGMHFAPACGEGGLGQRLEAVKRLAYAVQPDRVRVTHCWVITPLTNQSMDHSSPSDSASPSAALTLPSRSEIGPA